MQFRLRVVTLSLRRTGGWARLGRHGRGFAWRIGGRVPFSVREGFQPSTRLGPLWLWGLPPAGPLT